MDDSRPPTRGSEAPTVGSEVPTVGAEDSTGATAPPPAPPSEAPSGLSRLSRTASGEEEHFVEPKYLRPGVFSISSAALASPGFHICCVDKGTCHLVLHQPNGTASPQKQSLHGAAAGYQET